MRTKLVCQIVAQLAAIVVLCAAVQPRLAAITPHHPDREKEAADVRALRNAGLHGDRTRIPTMIDWIRPSSFPQMTRIALHSLAQLGATDALPAIDLYVKSSGIDERGFTQSTRARLVAEAAASSTADPDQKASLRVSTFYRELGLTPDQLNQAVAQFYRNNPTGVGTPPVDVYAMRDLADMAYVGPYVPYTTLPGIVGVDFSLDYPSKLKMQLARLNHRQRMDFLIDALSHRTAGGANETCEVQMLVDEGPEVVQPAEKRLMEMDQRRTEYPNAGFKALFDVLRQLDDQENDAVWRHFRAAPDGYLGYAAQWGPQELPLVAGY